MNIWKTMPLLWKSEFFVAYPDSWKGVIVQGPLNQAGLFIFQKQPFHVGFVFGCRYVSCIALQANVACPTSLALMSIVPVEVKEKEGCISHHQTVNINS